MAFIDKRLKTYVLLACASAAALLAACGGSSNSSSSSTTKLTGLKKRVLVSNQASGAVTIFDAAKDQVSARSFSASGASKLVTASGNTVVMQQGTTVITVINNVTETTPVQLSLRDQVFDVAISNDGKTAYAAERNVGEIAIFNTTNGNLSSITGIPLVTRLVEGTNEHKMLVFTDNPIGGNTFYVIDTATNNFTPISAPQLDQPYSAVFDPGDSNDTTAFILNCGPECGGTTASVIKVNFSNPLVPTFSAPIPVSAATVGVLSGSSLFVAGSPGAGSTGSVQTINTGSLTASAALTITNGHHLKMVMASNNRLYIGASGCTATLDNSTGLMKGCLTIVNTSSNAVVIPEVSPFRQNFDATGIQPISGRTVVYVCQGGELDIYDTTTDVAVQPSPPIDIIGKAIDVTLIDP
ncbi:MAG TPA: hypothetical protein VN176_03785 [Verrucomicrobiae bacterium]|jgi:hypothetical protein|nr:hypothetical protein [Verrucomicrobiae bacterium]